MKSAEEVIEMYQLNVVIVEDDPLIGELLQFNLQNNNYEPHLFQDGQSMFEALKQLMPVSLFVLDVTLPGIDGFEICRRLKNDPEMEPVPVIMLTARGAESDRIRGLTIGADDYMSKPFSIREFLARVEALMRRYGRIRTIEAAAMGTRDSVARIAIGDVIAGADNGVGAANVAYSSLTGSTKLGTTTGGEAAGFTIQQAREIIVFGPLRIDDLGHRVFVNGRETDMTNREYELLKFLVQHPGIAFSRDQLLHEVWGHRIGFDRNDTRTVDIHVHQVRRKIEADDPNMIMIETLRGFGYRMVDIIEKTETQRLPAAGSM